jgi:hypothetical protein
VAHTSKLHTMMEFMLLANKEEKLQKLLTIMMIVTMHIKITLNKKLMKPMIATVMFLQM